MDDFTLDMMDPNGYIIVCWFMGCTYSPGFLDYLNSLRPKRSFAYIITDQMRSGCAQDNVVAEFRRLFPTQTVENVFGVLHRQLLTDIQIYNEKFQSLFGISEDYIAGANSFHVRVVAKKSIHDQMIEIINS